MVEGRFLKGFAGIFGFEINGQVAVDNRWVSGYVANIAASDRINGVDQVVRFVQSVALLLITGQWVGSFPVESVEVCVLCVS